MLIDGQQKIDLGAIPEDIVSTYKGTFGSLQVNGAATVTGKTITGTLQVNGLGTFNSLDVNGLGTFNSLDVDNLNLNLNTLSSSSNMFLDASSGGICIGAYSSVTLTSTGGNVGLYSECEEINLEAGAKVDIASRESIYLTACDDIYIESPTGDIILCSFFYNKLTLDSCYPKIEGDIAGLGVTISCGHAAVFVIDGCPDSDFSSVITTCSNIGDYDLRGAIRVDILGEQRWIRFYEENP